MNEIKLQKKYYILAVKKIILIFISSNTTQCKIHTCFAYFFFVLLFYFYLYSKPWSPLSIQLYQEIEFVKGNCHLVPLFFFWFTSINVKRIYHSAGYVSTKIYFTLKRKGKGSYAKVADSWATDGGEKTNKIEHGPEWEKRPPPCGGCRWGRAYAVMKRQGAESRSGSKRKRKSWQHG